VSIYTTEELAATEISGASEAACILKQILCVKYNSNWDDHYHLVTQYTGTASST